MSDYREIKIVDNGNVFNTEHWYTFYCPNCDEQIEQSNFTREDYKYKYYACSGCGKITYLFKEKQYGTETKKV